LTQLHVAHGNALIAARGYGAQDTTEAFAKAREAASGDKDAPGRLAADYGLWVGGYVRGELTSMRAHAAVFLRDVEAMPDSCEAGVAHRVQGTTHQFAGEYVEARHHLERALALFQPGRDDDLAFRFGHDAGVAAMVYLSIVLWPLGEVDRAVSLIDRMQTRIAVTSHIGTHGMGKTHAALFELMRGHRARAALHAVELADITRERDLPMFHAFSVFLEGWAASQSGAPAQGLEDMRRGVELLREQNVLLFDGLLKSALAEAEHRAGDPDRAVAILDKALATSDRTGHRAFDAELHRARGEILLKRDPANPVPAGNAFLTAIVVAKRQATRSFELRAALSLAKLYQSPRRRPRRPRAGAGRLFAHARNAGDRRGAGAAGGLTQAGEVKAQASRRQRLTQLQLAYGNAFFAARGSGVVGFPQPRRPRLRSAMTALRRLPSSPAIAPRDAPRRA
jgi:predicted ATPase